MPNKIIPSANTSRSTGISGASVNNGAGSLSSEINFSSTPEETIHLELTATHGTAPSAAAPWYVYLLTAVDGTNYEDGSSSIQPQRVPDAIFNMRNITTAQKVTCRNIRIGGAAKTKVLIWNAAGQNATSVTLLAYSGSPEVQ